MTKLYIDGTNRVIHAAPDDGADPPDSTTMALAFDAATNAAVQTAVSAEPWRYTISGGTLLRDGQAVTIAAAGTAYTQRQQVVSQAQQVIDDITTYLALGSPTNAQTVAAFREVAQVVRYLIRHIVQELD